MGIKGQLLTALGIILVILGAIGIFLPVWPTTPFLLASVACLSPNPKLQQKVLKIPFVKEYLDNYKSRDGLPLKTVLSSLSFLWGMLLISMVITKNIKLIIFLSLVGILVTIHILWISRKRL